MSSRSRTPWITLLAILLCVLHAWMAASVSRTFSTTSDENVHLTSGYAYWKTNDYRLQPENGNFPQRWAALPLLWMDIKFPPTQGADWDQANIWKIGHEFFYTQGNDRPAMLAAGRAMIAALSALLCLVIFFWTRELFGVKAGLLALVMAVFSPEFLAHGGLITSDTAATLGFAIALLSCWRLLNQPGPGRLLAAGLCVGLLALSKYSVVLFVPMAALLVLLRLGRPAPMPWGRRRIAGWRRIPFAVGLLLGTAMICVAIIWSAYGFRYSAATPSEHGHPDFIRPWENVLLDGYKPEPMMMADGSPVDQPDRNPGAVQHVVRFFRDHRLLPESWLYGLAFVEINSRGRLAYFSGEYRITGWHEFFPTAFALKTTLPALALIALGTAAMASLPHRRRRVFVYRAAPLLALLVVYWIFSVQSKLNIGHRHLLPTYVACYVIAGGACLLARRHRAWWLVLIPLAAWHVRESVAIRPDYLAYFNPIAGGPSQAHRLFVDSSLDWGQDLPRLNDWVHAHATGEKLFLSYFGTGSPRHEGLENAVRIGDGYFDWYGRKTPPTLSGGVYCISATMLHRVYTNVRGPWSLGYEKSYQNLTAWRKHVDTRIDGKPQLTDLDGAPLSRAQINDLLSNYEYLMFGRLCLLLEMREPDARVGYSFLIWRLSDEDVAMALKAPLPVLNDYLTQTRTSH